jgi:hypothetical protein
MVSLALQSHPELQGGLLNKGGLDMGRPHVKSGICDSTESSKGDDFLKRCSGEVIIKEV